MTYKDLVERQPLLLSFADKIPNEIDGVFVVKKFSASSVICNKDDELLHVGVLIAGCFRVLSELETGDVFEIEKQTPVAFIGTIACLTNASIMLAKYETITECEIAYIPINDFKYWLKNDNRFLWAVSTQIAKRLREDVYFRFAEYLILSPMYLVLRYIMTDIGCRSSTTLQGTGGRRWSRSCGILCRMRRDTSVRRALLFRWELTLSTRTVRSPAQMKRMRHRLRC